MLGQPFKIGYDPGACSEAVTPFWTFKLGQFDS